MSQAQGLLVGVNRQPGILPLSCLYMDRTELPLKRIDYRTPQENKDLGEDDLLLSHTIEAVDEEGKVVGGAVMKYFSKPIPYYLVDEFYIDYELHGKRVGSRIMDLVEKKLKEKDRSGVLANGIGQDEDAAGMYERRGWVQIPGGIEGQLVFNADKEQLVKLKGFESRGTELLDRPGWKVVNRPNNNRD